MSNPKKKSTSADKEEEEEEERATNTEAVTTTTTTVTVVTPPTRRRALQVSPGSGGNKRSKSSDVKGAGSSSSTTTGKQKRKSGELDAPSGEPKCPICGMRFGSWKGYFGHLRVHPERHWPGAFPPPIWKADPPMVDEQLQRQMVSELSRIGQETLRKMRQEESNIDASSTRARNISIDLNVEPGGEDADFDLNLPPSNRNDDGDDNDNEEEDAPPS